MQKNLFFSITNILFSLWNIIYSNWANIELYYICEQTKKLFKAKVNIRTRTSKIYGSEYHVDIIEKIEGHKTAIYYLNTNDGYTLFKSGEKVKSVGNRLVVFDGQLYHYGTTCTDQNIRSVLNINYS